MRCDFRFDHPRRSKSGCLFPEENTVEFGGKMWCRFHLPLSNEDGNSPKAGWDDAEVDAFHDAIFAYIDEARSRGRVADLSGAVLPWDLSFARYASEANSLPEVLFAGTRFGGDARFTNVIFGLSALFDQAVFEGDAWFNGAEFRGDASFNEVEFTRLALFDKAVFDNDVGFDRAAIGDMARFTEAKFGAASFEDTRFSEDTWFDGANFRGPANFGGATFAGAAWLDRACFMSGALFTRAAFHRVYFQEARFHHHVLFDGAEFGDYASFKNARFDRRAFFNGSGATASEGPTFGFVDFTGAKFGGLAQFNNRKFLDTTIFSGASFERAPEFHGSTLHHDTTFPGQANFRDWGGADAARAYRTLKYAMASVHARGEEAKFFALEQKSLLRDKGTPLSTKVFSRLYWWASDYGQSVLRPLAWILAFFILFLGIYILYLRFHLDPLNRLVIPPIDFEHVFRFALQQVFQPFDVFRARPAPPPGALPAVLQNPPPPLALLAAAHSVVTLSLLALFLLALRRRFKLD